MGKAWKKFWSGFEKMMDALPGLIDEAFEDGIPGSTTMVNKNGHVALHGSFKSLRINGKLIRIPGNVLGGKDG